MVSAHVGRGTFVRGGGARPASGAGSATRSPGSATPCRRPTRPTATGCWPRCTASRPARRWSRSRSATRPSASFPVARSGAAIDAVLRRAARGGRCSTPTSRACPSWPRSWRALSAAARGARGSRRHPDHQRRRPGPGARLPRDPAARRRRRLRGPELHRRDPLDARHRRRDRRRPHATTDGLDVDALEALLARREIRLLALQPRLHNPTGRDLSTSAASGCSALARRHGFFILEDGIYCDLRFAGEPSPSLRSQAPAHVVYVDSLSKTVGGGLRIGWVAASGPVLDRIIAAKRSDDIHSPTLTQLAVARYLAGRRLPGAGRARPRLLRRERSTRCARRSTATWGRSPPTSSRSAAGTCG